MAIKKYISYDRMKEYDELIKGEIYTGDASILAKAKSYAESLVSSKSDKDHTHDDIYYTKKQINEYNALFNDRIDEKIPTKVSELENDSGFKTTDNNTTYELTNTDSTIALVGSDGSTSFIEINNLGITVDSELSTESENPVQNKIITESLEDKVDKVDGKGLSTNDFTNADKEKLDSLSDSSKIQSNWTQIDSSEKDYIKNKPFGEVNIAIEFNGDLTGKTVISFNDKQYVHVNDLFISQNLLIGTVLTNNLGTATTVTSDDAAFVQYGEYVYGYTNDSQDVLFVSENNATYESDSFELKGTYLFHSEDATIAQTVSLAKNEITKIDSKYLPGSALTNEQVLSLIDRVNELEKGIAKFG